MASSSSSSSSSSSLFDNTFGLSCSWRWMIFLVYVLFPIVFASCESVPSIRNDCRQVLKGVTILTTTPLAYSKRLRVTLEAAGAQVISCPTIETTFLTDPKDIADLKSVILDQIQSYDYVAFTSRRAMDAFLNYNDDDDDDDSSNFLLELFSKQHPCVIALGVDAERLVVAGVKESAIIRINDNPTPQGIVRWLESTIPPMQRAKIRVLCPVPKVVNLTEPPVVPEFLAALQSLGLGAVDPIPAYVTKWTGDNGDDDDDSVTNPKNVLKLLKNGQITVIAITSTAEVEGLLRMIQTAEQQRHVHGRDTTDWRRRVKIVAHGPVTARGAQAFGVLVDGISEDSSSFAGMVTAIAKCLSFKENNKNHQGTTSDIVRHHSSIDDSLE